jgi:TPR repeat protein
VPSVYLRSVSRLDVLKAKIAAAEKRPPSQHLVQLLRDAARLNDVDALLSLGMYARDGLRDRKSRTLVRRSRGASIKYYRRAVELGSVLGMQCLATAMTEDIEGRGRWTPASLPRVREALALHRRAVRLGGDCYNLAVTYQNMGQHKKAVAWFRKNADAGQIDALLPLAKAELYGVGTRRNVQAAMEKLKRVAAAEPTYEVSPFDKGEAMRLIAEVLRDAWFAPRHYDAAVRWLRRAAKSGSDAAAGLLSELGEPSRRMRWRPSPA